MNNIKKFFYSKKTFFCIKAFVKMLLFTYVFFALKFSIEISLILSVISILIIEKFITKELFQLTASCKPEIPNIDVRAEKEFKAVIQIVFADFIKGKCIPLHPYTFKFEQDMYVNQGNSKFKQIPPLLLQVKALSDSKHTSVRLSIQKGYEMIITNTSDNKISFGSPEKDIVIENLNQFLDAFKNLKYIEVNDI